MVSCGEADKEAELGESEPLNISDIEAIYEKTLKEMQKENFYGGYRCTQDIDREEVTIRIFGEEKDEYSIDYSR